MKYLQIYCDGACPGNGFTGAKSSYGLYCEETHYCEYGGGGFEGKHTNNTGELIGILRSLEYAKGKTNHVIIYSDSQYAINSCVLWNINKKKKKNKPLILKAKAAMIPFKKVEMRWVKGHNSCYGNEIADALSNEWLKENR
jgi:ribonuclease HI